MGKNHMYKQGWVEGKGLGRYETGMKSAIKVKIKRDQAGMGHDMAEEFTFQWWDHVFNRAASKIKLKGEDDFEGSDSDDDAAAAATTTDEGASFDISNKKPTKKKYDPKQILYGRFVSGGLLVDENNARLREVADVAIDSNGVVVHPTSAPPSVANGADDNDGDSSDSEEELMKLYAAAGLPEEELLRRCGGRTAHKGARHGLKASAKLERIERQEGGAKSGPTAIPEVNAAAAPATLESTPPLVKKEKKRKKRSADADSPTKAGDDPPKKKSKKKENKEKLVLTENTNSDCAALETEEFQTVKKRKKKKRKREDGENEKEAPITIVEPIPKVPAAETTVVVETKTKKKKTKMMKSKLASESPLVVEEIDKTDPIVVSSNEQCAGDVGKNDKRGKKKKKRDTAL